MELIRPLLCTLSCVGAVTVGDSTAQATGFDGFGDFGGFRGFHQFNGLMSRDLEGQFDSTGFNRDFSAAETRRFDTGYGQHFLEGIDDDSFDSGEKSSSSQQKQGRPSLPRYHQPLPTTHKPQLRQGKAINPRDKNPYAIQTGQANPVSYSPVRLVAATRQQTGSSTEREGFGFGPEKFY